MTASISRSAIALFSVLSAAVAVNLTLLQPATHLDRADARNPTWGAVNETAALEVPELDRRIPTGQNTAGPVPSGSSPLTPGISQRIVVEPPQANPAEITRAIQTALQAKGYETGGTDGIAGPVTQAAILAYEIDNSLPLTAEPSDAVLARIKAGRRGATTSAGLAPGPKADTLIRSVQTALAKLGYRVGRADGRLGEATIAAIRAFEKQQSMPDTGRISGDLLTRLTRLSTPPRTAGTR